MKRISIDNGRNYYSGGQERAISDQIDERWDAIVEMMDDETREHAHREFTGGDNLDFLNLYLSMASDDLVIG